LHDALLSSDQVDDFFIVSAVAFTTRMQRAMVRDVLREEDLPLLEWRLLFSVARFGSCHLAYITQRTSIDPAHGSRAVTALERKGLIARSDDPHNRRRKVISLTTEGVALFKKIWPRAQGLTQRVTDALDPRDFAEIKRLMGALNTAAEPLMDPAPAETSEMTQQKDTTLTTPA